MLCVVPDSNLMRHRSKAICALWGTVIPFYQVGLRDWIQFLRSSSSWLCALSLLNSPNLVFTCVPSPKTVASLGAVSYPYTIFACLELSSLPRGNKDSNIVNTLLGTQIIYSKWSKAWLVISDISIWEQDAFNTVTNNTELRIFQHELYLIISPRAQKVSSNMNVQNNHLTTDRGRESNQGIGAAHKSGQIS